MPSMTDPPRTTRSCIARSIPGAWDIRRFKVGDDRVAIVFREEPLDDEAIARTGRLANVVAGDRDSELVEFFRRAQNESRKGAEQGKILLARRIGS